MTIATPVEVERLTVPLNIVDVKFTNTSNKFLRDPDWNVDRYGMSLGINLECPTNLSFSPVMLPSNKFDELSVNFYLRNPSKENLRSRLLFKGLDGKPRYLPVVWTSKELGILSFDIPKKEVSVHMPFTCTLNVRTKKTLYLESSWLETAVSKKG